MIKCESIFVKNALTEMEKAYPFLNVSLVEYWEDAICLKDSGYSEDVCVAVVDEGYLAEEDRHSAAFYDVLNSSHTLLIGTASINYTVDSSILRKVDHFLPYHANEDKLFAVLTKVAKDEQARGAYFTKQNPFTTREQQVMRLILADMNNEEIAEKLSLSRRTIESHKYNMVNKANVKTVGGLISYCMKNEILLSPKNKN